LSFCINITAALYGQITLKDGRVEQSNFDSYQMLRMNEAPIIDGYIIQSSEPPGGMGEPGTSAIVPTVTNAIFAATGKRLRKLPIDPHRLEAAGVNGIPSLRPENRRGGLNCLEAAGRARG
jgi:isoquinoline 1-oxidoreductase subunit beta